MTRQQLLRRCILMLVMSVVPSALLHAQAVTSVVVPRYMEGLVGTNTDRIPFACRLRLTGLLASKTYRFINQMVTSTDGASSNGSGNCIFVTQTGDFVRSQSASLSSAGNYGTFTTDATGTYEGWFVTEPTGGGRFVPGKFLFMRIALNDGGTGTTVATRVTTSDSIRVLKLSPTATDSTGTGLRGGSFAKEKDFVFTYDNTTGVGRPISGSFIERDGTDNSISNSYSAFYANNVDDVRGAFGMVLPNLLPTGVRRVERRSLASGGVLTSATDADGLWPSGAQTVNPLGGATAIVLKASDVNYLATGLAIDPSSIAYGNVIVSASKTDSVICKNTTAAPLSITTIVSSDTSAWAITSPTGSVTIPAGGTTKVKIVFHPRVPGERVGRITFNNGGATSPDTIHVTGNGVGVATSVVFPRYMEGMFGANNDRLPFACRLRLTKLLASRTYRFYNQVVDSNDPPNSEGSGNPIFAMQTGDFVRTDKVDFDSTGHFGTFTTDATGAYEGWFITEPTGGSRFLPGKFVFMRIALNDGGTGNTVYTRITTTDSVRIVKLSPGATDSTGTGLRGKSFAREKDFVFTYDNTAGTGRPISGTYIERDGSSNSLSTSYSLFYDTYVNGVRGAYGMVLPNLLATGVRRVERRSLASGAIVTSATDADGLWPSGAQTVNPNAGATAIALTGTDVNYLTVGLAIDPSEISFREVNVSATKIDSVLVKNTTGSSFTINTIVSSDTSAFAITSSAGPITLSAGSTAKVTIAFHPRIPGQRDGRITFTHTGPGSPDTLHVDGNGLPIATAVLFPRFMEGVFGTNSNRVPFACRLRLTKLLANTTYRYFNQVVDSSDPYAFDGAGNPIFAKPSGSFVRTTTVGFDSTAYYSTLTTDASGAYEGWFITEPTGGARFLPGKFVFMRIMLNDGGAGTTVFTRATTTDSVRIVKLSSGATDSTGTGLRGTTFASARDFIFTYDNTTGTGRPISGSFVESDGTANTAANSYSSFYAISVDNVPGAFGMVLPNLLPTGVRRVERRGLVTGAIVTSATDPDGLWPSGAQTVNPTGGTTAIVLASTDVGYLSAGLVLTPSSLAFGNVAVNASKIDSLLAKNTAGQSVTISSIVSSDTSAFAVTSSPGPLTLLPGDSTRVRIAFHPRVAGPRGGRITFTNTGPTSPDTLHVSGTGVVPVIAITPSPLLFGALSVTQSQVDTVLVRNPGGATLSISSIVSGNVSQFGVLDAGPMSVAPGDTARIRVTFHPTSAGQKDGRITFTHNGSTSPDTIHVQGLAVLMTARVPRYLEGTSGTNTNRVPFAYRAHFEGLLANHTYRYFNQAVTSADPPTGNGSGNCIFAAAAGAFVRSTTPDLATAGNYGTLTTDSLGVGEGWFVTEPTGNSRFASGGFVFMRISINDGGAGTTVFGRLTTADSVRVVKLGPAPDDSSGTGLRGTSGGGPGEFVLVFDDSSGTSRPVAGSFVENDGTFNSAGNGYATFYANSVDTVGGAFGVVVPNVLPKGITRVERRSLASGAVLGFVVNVGGNWPSGANTVNPLGGTSEIVLTLADLSPVVGVEPPSVPIRFMLSQNGPNPFHPTTTIRFSVAESGVATLVIYDVLGHVAAVPFNGLATPGREYTVTVDGNRLRSGVYWYRLKSGNRTATRKMVLLR